MIRSNLDKLPIAQRTHTADGAPMRVIEQGQRQSKSRPCSVCVAVNGRKCFSKPTFEACARAQQQKIALVWSKAKCLSQTLQSETRCGICGWFLRVCFDKRVVDKVTCHCSIDPIEQFGQRSELYFRRNRSHGVTLICGRNWPKVWLPGVLSSVI